MRRLNRRLEGGSEASYDEGERWRIKGSSMD